ncbi:MAG: hypothetical protein AAF570_19305 [Bacteroidota bacterium]
MVKQIQVGMPFEVEMRIRHPETMTVVFPDSLKDFAPFELHSSKPLPTQTNEGTSVDVVMYKLYAWEIDSIQFVQLPGRYIDEDQDTIVVLSNREALEFLPEIDNYTDSLKVKWIEEVAEIAEPFDWKMFGIILVAVVIILGAALYFLWNPIQNMFRRWQINREWKKYTARLQKVPSILPDQEAYVSALNKVWKAYFDRDWKLALGSMTTEELRYALPKMEHLKAGDRTNLLRISESADRIMYAQKPMEEAELREYYQEVSNIMEREYTRRKQEAEI